MAGPVRGLRRRRYQGLQVTVVLEAEVVRRALDRLPQRMRTAVMLRYFEDMTEPEIAAVLGISLGTVKSTVSRAVAKLRIDAELGEDSGA